MPTPRLPHSIRWLLFATVLLAAATVREGPSSALDQAIIWLPTGVAMAGLCLLGLRAWWVVAITTFVQRMLLGYGWTVALPAAVGSTLEAVLGVFVLGRFGFDPSLARLRDVGALLVAAAVAPLGSILCSWPARMFVWSDPNMPFYSGWDGWWRMNALGVLTVVPVTLTWRSVPPADRTPRFYGAVALAVIGLPAVLFATMLVVPAGINGVMCLNIVLTTVVLYAAGRFGIRGATLAGTLAALAVALATTRGHGPFLALPREYRHVALQLFELTFVVIPPAFGALIAERRAAQAEGARSDLLRRSIQSALPDITYRLRRDGVCLDVSAPTGVELPIPAAEIVGQSVLERFPRAKAEEFRSVIQAAIQSGQLRTIEYVTEFGGQHHFREARCVPYGDDEVLAIVRDITDRKWNEETTAFEADVLARVATGCAPVEVFAELVDGMQRLMPGSRCSVMVLDGNRLHMAMAPSLPAEYAAAIEGLEIGPAVGSCGSAAALGRTVVVQDIERDPLWRSYRDAALPHGLRACWSVPIRASGGVVLGTFAIYHGEVREPRPFELQLVERAGVLAGIALERESRSEALRRSQDLLASINRNVKEGLFRASPDLRLVYANLAMARLLGWDSPDDVLGHPLGESFEEAGRATQVLAAVREHGQWLNEEVRFVRRDGSSFWGSLSGTAVRDERGVIAWYDGAIADVTARKELEEQFRQSQKMEAVGKLAGGVAHDFNNLLTVILGYAEAIQSAATDQPRVREQASQVVQAAKRASGLTRQLLAYSRQQVLSPCVMELGSVIEHMSGMLYPLVGEDVHLVVERRSAGCWVRVDRSQIEQVVLNLVVNARDAMPDGGTLSIRTTIGETGPAVGRAHAELAGRPCVLLSVTDTGMGMAPEVQAKAFDPFFTTKALGRGTGLGLSTVFGIVQQSGGAVWLQSAPGAGTTVWIALPLLPAPAEAPAEPVTTAPHAPGGTVLVVEDEQGVRSLVCQLLQRDGYHVLEACDGETALELASAWTGPIDLVVTDLVMPRMGGREMATRLLRGRPGTNFLFISGYPDDPATAHEFAGGGGFLNKPFAPEQLLQRVRDLSGPWTARA